MLVEDLGTRPESWSDDHDTGFHDHDVSAGAVTVVRGRIREERLRLGREPLTREFSDGAYTVEDGGALRRHSVSYAEELRPLAPA